MKITGIKSMLKSVQKTGLALKVSGDAGIGKTEIVKQFAQENGNHLEVLLLANQEVGDLIGIPHTVEKHGQQITEWSKPVWLQRMELSAFPLVSDLDDLVFNDKEFEQFVLDNYTPHHTDL